MKNAIKEKSYQFAIKTVQTYKYLSESRKEFVLSKQLLRSVLQLGRWCGKRNKLKVNLTLFTKWLLR